MIRTKEWKYVHRYPYGKHELYHLVDDPGEEKNLYGLPEYKKLVTQLKGRMEKWFCTYSDPAIDGVRSAVNGSGQLCRPGVYAIYEDPFAPKGVEWLRVVCQRIRLSKAGQGKILWPAFCKFIHQPDGCLCLFKVLHIENCISAASVLCQKNRSTNSCITQHSDADCQLLELQIQQNSQKPWKQYKKRDMQHRKHYF